ncbi:hypothetical protein AL073_13760 [Loktanella sp. 1ANDIMAR09]|nr:hypothetical protein AL073_13760 [Loktanella sp. 1ANDIMAR09]
MNGCRRVRTIAFGGLRAVDHLEVTRLAHRAADGMPTGETAFDVNNGMLRLVRQTRAIDAIIVQRYPNGTGWHGKLALPRQIAYQLL